MWLAVAATTCVGCDKGNDANTSSGRNGLSLDSGVEDPLNSGTTLRRLTNVQYRNTLNTVFGPGVVVTTVALPILGFSATPMHDPWHAP